MPVVKKKTMAQVKLMNAGGGGARKSPGGGGGKTPSGKGGGGGKNPSGKGGGGARGSPGGGAAAGRQPVEGYTERGLPELLKGGTLESGEFRGIRRPSRPYDTSERFDQTTYASGGPIAGLREENPLASVSVLMLREAIHPFSTICQNPQKHQRRNAVRERRLLQQYCRFKVRSDLTIITGFPHLDNCCWFESVANALPMDTEELVNATLTGMSRMTEVKNAMSLMVMGRARLAGSERMGGMNLRGYSAQESLDPPAVQSLVRDVTTCMNRELTVGGSTFLSYVHDEFQNEAGMQYAKSSHLLTRVLNRSSTAPYQPLSFSIVFLDRFLKKGFCGNEGRIQIQRGIQNRIRLNADFWRKGDKKKNTEHSEMVTGGNHWITAKFEFCGYRRDDRSPVWHGALIDPHTRAIPPSRSNRRPPPPRPSRTSLGLFTGAEEVVRFCEPLLCDDIEVRTQTDSWNEQNPVWRTLSGEEKRSTEASIVFWSPLSPGGDVDEGQLVARHRELEEIIRGAYGSDGTVEGGYYWKEERDGPRKVRFSASYRRALEPYRLRDFRRLSSENLEFFGRLFKWNARDMAYFYSAAIGSDVDRFPQMEAGRPEAENNFFRNGCPKPHNVATGDYPSYLSKKLGMRDTEHNEDVRRLYFIAFCIRTGCHDDGERYEQFCGVDGPLHNPMGDPVAWDIAITTYISEEGIVEERDFDRRGRVGVPENACASEFVFWLDMNRNPPSMLVIEELGGFGTTGPRAMDDDYDRFVCSQGVGIDQLEHWAGRFRDEDLDFNTAMTLYNTMPGDEYGSDFSARRDASVDQDVVRSSDQGVAGPPSPSEHVGALDGSSPVVEGASVHHELAEFSTPRVSSDGVGSGSVGSAYETRPPDPSVQEMQGLFERTKDFLVARGYIDPENYTRDTEFGLAFRRAGESGLELTPPDFFFIEACRIVQERLPEGTAVDWNKYKEDFKADLPSFEAFMNVVQEDLRKEQGGGREEVNPADHTDAGSSGSGWPEFVLRAFGVDVSRLSNDPLPGLTRGFRDTLEAIYTYSGERTARTYARGVLRRTGINPVITSSEDQSTAVAAFTHIAF